MFQRDSLPLHYSTPNAWAIYVLSEPLTLLCDHAYLERKAASNAMDLLNQWTDEQFANQWVLTLSNIARDETAHLYTVSKLISERDGKLSRKHKSTYAHALRGLVRFGEHTANVLDRLLVSALIEARSCERFLILSECATDTDLKHLYTNLYASEAGHYHVFLKLAETVTTRALVEERWQELLKAEADIIQAQPKQICLHSSY